MTPRRIANVLFATFVLLMLAASAAILGAVFGYWSLP